MSQSRPPRALWILLLAVATLPFWDLGHPLWEVDDARYAEIPREMVENGDWLTPRLNYFLYLEKPPLIYWLGALSYTTFGVSEAAARLPLALLSLLSLAGTAWLGAWLFSLEVGIIAAALLGTCVQFQILSRLITPDMAVSTALLWASALLLRGLRRPEDAGWAGAGAGACMALAFLAKGLIGIFFPAAWTLLLALIFADLRPGFKRLLSGWMIPVFALLTAPWFIAMEQRHPGFFRFFFWEQQVLRYLTPLFHRDAPWYYFIGVHAGGMLPWTVPALASTAAAARRWRETDARLRQLLLWCAIIFLFFSASKSKLPTYVLPLFPHQCLLIAELLQRTLGGTPELLRKVTRTCAVSFALTGIGLIFLRTSWGEPLMSVRPMARLIASQIKPEDRLYCYGIYLHGLPFYLKRPVDVLSNWIGELYYAKRDPRNAERFGGEEKIRELPLKDRTVFVAFRKSEEAFILSISKPSALHRFGRWTLAVYRPSKERAETPACWEFFKSGQFAI